ncbi:helix-turn-helix transcriptional regulator [Fusibacter paucivorans]|uniref:Helix-turn-helix transcriptional regulator n=1 Tax=Fusibacter paucivorans TaxID=76009 RepID=A0ABS5PSZ7_9FIRM|nr:helix-turn-helix transcriptional regulator [Fusibacter paucivorans]
MINIDDIGKKLKKIRTDKNITLKQLSEKTSLSISFISQVERGVSSLTVTSLKKIADALGVSLNDVVTYKENDSYAYKKDHPVFLRMRNDYASHQIVSGKFDGKKLEGIIFTIAANTEMDSFAHEGEEFHYVIKGKADFYIDDVKYVVEAGDTIHFPSTIDHKICNSTDDEIVIMSVLTPSLF